MSIKCDCCNKQLSAYKGDGHRGYAIVTTNIYSKGHGTTEYHLCTRCHNIVFDTLHGKYLDRCKDCKYIEIYGCTNIYYGCDNGKRIVNLEDVACEHFIVKVKGEN
jgi:hypothetical protein